MKTSFIPIDYDYVDIDSRNYIRLIGRTDSGKRIAVIDSYEPFFWLILDEKASKDQISALKEKVSKLTVERESRTSNVLKIFEEEKQFLGRKVNVLKVYLTNHKDASDMVSAIGDSEIISARRGHDVPLITNYIMQGGCEPFVWYEVEGEYPSDEDYGGIMNTLDVDIVLSLEEKKKKKTENKVYEPRVLSYDIESEIGEVGQGEVYMIGLYGKDFQKVFTWKEHSNEDYIVSCEDEEDMISKFISAVKSYDPDILCGYFSDGYDLPFLRERAMKKKIPFDLSIDGSKVSFSRGAIQTGKIGGIVHVDIYRFIASVFSQYLAAESLSLSEVASELLGETKDDFDFSRLASMKKKDWDEFISYNLRDVEVTYKLFMKIWPDMYEFTQIVKEPLFRISRDTMATDVENYVLHNLSRFDEIPERNPGQEEIGERRNLGKYEGAFVYEPTPGFYENIVMFDFTSMYGSVIVSYNLSRSTFLSGEEPEDYEFSKEKGFFPILLEEVISLRKKYKEEYAQKKDNMSKARSNAYKLLSNAAYGYLGFFGARYYSREAASSTARLAKENILKAIENIKKEGYEILYSDTDSIAFLQGSKSKKDVLNFLKKLNDKLPGIMELDLEDFYTRGIFVSKRGGGGSGAKKKYALMGEDNTMKIRGFETVRRDWCLLARNLQRQVLEAILEGNKKKAEKILREAVSRLKSRKVSVEELVLKTQLKKPLSSYVAEGPHVVAAKKMKKEGIKITTGMLVEYYIGEGKGKRIGDRVRLPHEPDNYDMSYYLENQVLPAVENIFEVFGIEVADIISGQTQKGLFDFA